MFTIGAHEFASKAAAHRHLSAMLEVWWKQAEITGTDRDLLEVLIDQHPEAAITKGSGVRAFFVSHAEPKGRCFWVWRTDGSSEHFSFLQCLNGRTPDRTKLRTACREAAHPSVHAFKVEAFAGGMATCAETGALLAWGGAHVDHIEPFHVIADAWIDGSGVTVTDLAADTPTTYADTFADPKVAESFRAHHDRVARLRVVSAFVNLSKGGR
jgi:hypothetical protein